MHSFGRVNFLEYCAAPLLAASLAGLLCGCEIGFLGEATVGAESAAALESLDTSGFAAEDAAADEATTVRESGSAEVAAKASIDDWGIGRAAKAGLDAPLVENAEFLAHQSIGAEPVEGIIEHFDMQDKYLGKTVVTKIGGVTFDSRGFQTGYLKRFPGRTNIWDLNKKFRGSSEPSGQQTVIRDDQGEIRGYSKRTDNVITTYNGENTPVGHSKISPLTQKTFSAVPTVLGGAYVTVSTSNTVKGVATRNRVAHLTISNGHFEYYRCCLLKAVYRIANSEDSVPFKTEFAPRVNPYVTSPQDEVSGTALQMYTPAGGMAIGLSPGQATTIEIYMPIPASELSGAERLSRDQLTAFGCRKMRTYHANWAGFTYRNGSMIFPLPCPVK